MTVTDLLKIGDIAKQTGVSVGTLRYYETLKLLYPTERGDNGYRYYSPETVQQVQFIKKSQALGFSLEEIRQILGSVLKPLGSIDLSYERSRLGVSFKTLPRCP